MKRIIFTILFAVIALGLNAQVVKSLTNIAGTLSSVLTKNEKNTITNLTMRGTLDARDFKTMRDSMPVLSVIDISTAKIIEYTGTLGTASTRSTLYKESTIPANAFFNFSNQGKQTLNEMNLPSGVISIGNNAFRDCQNLELFSLPASLKSIGTRAFKTCINFYGELTIPTSVISIEESAFEESGVKKVIFNASINEISKKTFKDCGMLEAVVFPQTLVSIGDSSFFRCSDLMEFIFPNSLRTIGVRAFYDCWIGFLQFNEGLESIGEEAFYSCQISDFYAIPTTLSNIEKGAFRKTHINYFVVREGNQNYSSLNGVLFNKDFTELIKHPYYEIDEYEIPESVKIISPYAFEECDQILQVIIPSSVDSIGEGAFLNTTIAYIVLDDRIPIEITEYEIFDVFTSFHLHVPFGSKSLYQSTEPWSAFSILEGMLLEISDNTVYLPDNPNFSQSIEIRCNNLWTAVSDEEWLKTDLSTPFFGDTVITLTAEQNLGEERKANVIVMSSERIDTIFVTQYEFSGTLLSDSDIFLGAKENLTAVVEVLSSGMWIASSDKSWLTVTPVTPVDGSGTINIQAQQNTGDERSAIITVISEGKIDSISVVQATGTNSVSDLLNVNKLIVFPNPAEDFILLNDMKEGECVSIYNASGIKIKNSNIEINGVIDVSYLKSGVYFICIENKWCKFLKK